MSGSSLDGLDLAYAAIQDKAGTWSYDFLETTCYPYTREWKEKLRQSRTLGAGEYLCLDTAFGRHIGERICQFMAGHGLEYQVNFIACHGHTSFHLPDRHTTAQLGDGATIAAVTGLPVICGLRAMDLALGGQGAPIVPAGEKHLFGEYALLLNLGGIANISYKDQGQYRAFDICPANRVLDALAALEGQDYDDNGRMAASGQLNLALRDSLNAQPYYRLPFPKSLPNEFGTETIYPLILSLEGKARNSLRTYCEHIAMQVDAALAMFPLGGRQKMLVTGGGAFNGFLLSRLKAALDQRGVELVIPDAQLVRFKEALIMAFLGVLRWREMDTVLSSVTGASRDSSGGAIWLGRGD